MKKSCLSASLLAIAIGCSASAFAAVHFFEVIGEGPGRTAEEAVESALRDADEKCYRSWGRSAQEHTVLAEWIDPATGWPFARVSLECRVED
ncbi:hypothetical protein LDO26_06685 [Luteimonas sp. BDR2-5]|uniref:hypothetical protein n=1 Tax=Proluteimonas luteida TaxID=2878685 RepID=UPI001E3332F3|nr:hypothetical protein [Luteimonas sp. BDR2-5]MCD9027890.1 hypothetical protein [Luteimonas sp. BDR2-5]